MYIQHFQTLFLDLRVSLLELKNITLIFFSEEFLNIFTCCHDYDFVPDMIYMCNRHLALYILFFLHNTLIFCPDFKGNHLDLPLSVCSSIQANKRTLVGDRIYNSKFYSFCQYCWVLTVSFGVFLNKRNTQYMSCHQDVRMSVWKFC